MNIRSTSEDTEKTALTVLGNLKAQGERLHNVRDVVQKTDDHITTGNAVFTTLRRRVFANKALLWVIILLEIIAAIIILIFKIVKK